MCTMTMLAGMVAAMMAQLPSTAMSNAAMPRSSCTTLDTALAAINDADASRGLHVVITPGVWLPRLGGKARFDGLPAAEELTLETDLQLDDLEPSFNFELAITKGPKWQIDISGFDFSTDASGVFDVSGSFGEIAFSPGDSFNGSFDMTSAAIGVSYWQWHPIHSGPREDLIGNTDLRFAWGVNIRWLDLEQTLDVPGFAQQEGEGAWAVPSLVLKMDLSFDLQPSFPVIRTFQVLGSASIGPAIGGDGGVVGTLAAGIRCWVCHNFSLDFGYRLLEAQVENDDYELAGGLQGLFLSGTLGF
jgi:hypothetical protein